MENKWALFPALPTRFLGRRVTSSSPRSLIAINILFRWPNTPLFPESNQKYSGIKPEARVYRKLGVKLGVKSFRGIAVVPPPPVRTSLWDCLLALHVYRMYLSKKQGLVNVCMDCDGLHACWRLSTTQDLLP